MKVIGMVGGIGAGKSTIIRLINEIQPVSYISADKVGHDILLKGHPAYQQVVSHFGKGILDESGEIIRYRLGQCVFGYPEALATLNSITHPIIVQEVKKQIATYKKEVPDQHIILEAALLLESGLVALTDVVVAIFAKVDTRIERVIEREGLTKEQILDRINAQKQWEEVAAVSDYIIDNSLSIEETRQQLRQLLQQL